MAEGDQKGEQAPAEKTFTQADVDRVVQERLGRERAKYPDYDELKKFKDEQTKLLEEGKQKNLEEAGKFEEAKKTYEEKINNLNNGLQEKDMKYNDLLKDNALATAISINNAYEEAKHAVKPMVILDDNGVPKMKSKDTVGNEILVSVEEGMKTYLADKPYLIKGKAVQGGGTLPAGGGGQGGVEILDQLNAELIKVQGQGNNHAKVQELNGKIKAIMTSRGINRNM